MSKKLIKAIKGMKSTIERENQSESWVTDFLSEIEYEINNTTKTLSEQREEILRLEKTIFSMKSEVEYALRGNKSEEVNRVYLENAVRFANDVIYVE